MQHIFVHSRNNLLAGLMTGFILVAQLELASARPATTASVENKTNELAGRAQLARRQPKETSLGRTGTIVIAVGGGLFILLLFICCCACHCSPLALVKKILCMGGEKILKERNSPENDSEQSPR